MPEDTFRIVVTVAVGIAAIAFVFQAAILFAIYRASRKMQQTTAGFISEIKPVIHRAASVVEEVGPVMQKIPATIDRIVPVVERVGPMLDKAGPALERIGPMADKFGAFADRASAVAATANRLIDETRPRVAQISGETASLVRSGREQVEHLGGILHDAGDRAKARLQKIDEAVDNTVEQVENVSGAMKRAVMRPVKEVNGIAAGISAVVSTLVRGQRKSSVDEATQDEEMFI
jgi:ABC-type transporter Mla subunit MlaD